MARGRFGLKIIDRQISHAYQWSYVYEVSVDTSLTLMPQNYLCVAGYMDYNYKIDKVLCAVT